MTVENSSPRPINWKRLLVVIGGPVLLLYLSYSIIFPTYHFRYRLEFVVNDRGRVRTGSGVIEAEYHPPPNWIQNLGGGLTPGGASVVHGYAATINLGDKGLLFATLSRDDGDVSSTMGRLPLVAYDLIPSLDFTQALTSLRQLQQKSGWVDAPVAAMPRFVRFRNIYDPLSAEQVDPMNLTATYGEGIKLVSARLELTDDSVTSMPADWPSWLRSLKKGYLDGVSVGSMEPLGLQARDFKGD